MNQAELAKEWCLLQNQFDSYEKHSLLIKLASIGLVSSFYLTDKISFVCCFILIILWLQDAIWKTFQSRIEWRLRQLENYFSSSTIKENTTLKAYQLNAQFSDMRLTGFALLNEYFKQALRPTVAFPYVPLLILIVGIKFLIE